VSSGYTSCSTNIWAPITFTPGVILQFFKSRPFAWNGIFVFWIPAIVFGIQFIVNVVWLGEHWFDSANNMEVVETASGTREGHSSYATT
jgi:hypothetical protein